MYHDLLHDMETHNKPTCKVHGKCTARQQIAEINKKKLKKTKTKIKQQTSTIQTLSPILITDPLLEHVTGWLTNESDTVVTCPNVTYKWKWHCCDLSYCDLS